MRKNHATEVRGAFKAKVDDAQGYPPEKMNFDYLCGTFGERIVRVYELKGKQKSRLAEFDI